MDHLAAELAHALQRRLQVVYLKVRQRLRIARPRTSLVHAERGATA